MLNRSDPGCSFKHSTTLFGISAHVYEPEVSTIRRNLVQFTFTRPVNYFSSSLHLDERIGNTISSLYF